MSDRITILQLIIITGGSLQFAHHQSVGHAINEHRHQLTVRSLEKGLGRADVPLLDVTKGPGRKRVLESLLRRLNKTQFDIQADIQRIVREDINAKRIAMYGDGWKLKVYGDGTKARYRHYGYLQKRKRTLAQLPPITPEKLISSGRRFIEEILGDQVRLNKHETLIPFRIEYQIDAIQSADGKQAPRETTVAGAVVFSRAISGIDVLGTGSKIAVLFANDGTPFGFDYDWPKLSENDTIQTLAPLDEIKKRTRQVARLKDTAIHVRLQRFECGYYDPGQRHRGETTTLQAACVHFYTGHTPVTNANGEVNYLAHAFVDPIPAAATIKADKRWPVTLELLYGSEASQTGENTNGAFTLPADPPRSDTSSEQS